MQESRENGKTVTRGEVLLIHTMLKMVIRAIGFCIMAGCICLTLCLPETVNATLNKADKVIIIKSKRLMIVMKSGEIMKAYRVALGKQPVGHKTKTGDKRTPEGKYMLDSRKTDSKFHLAIHISYPNDADIENAQKIGVLPGGDIMIHGLPDKLQDVGELHRLTDWTDGCIAVTNREIEEIWKLVPDGTPIEINP